MSSTKHDSLQQEDILAHLSPSDDDTAKHLSTHDLKSIELLRKLDEYLTQYDSLTKNLKSAYMSLKRANYASNSKFGYGKDSGDLRLRLSNKILSIDEQGRIESHDNTGKSKPLSTMGEDEKNSEITNRKDKHSKKSSTEKNNDEQTITTGTTTAIATNDTVDVDGAINDNGNDENGDDEQYILGDPLKMFSGGFVQPSLKDSKKSFDKSLIDMIILTNLKGELLSIMDQLEI